MNAVPRVLMLPGYTQNSYILSGKMGAIRRALKDTAELVYIDPNPQTPEETARAWWFAEQREDSRHFLKLDETILYLRMMLEQHGPFDGVWGFSQGAACAAILTALVENPTMHPAFSASSIVPGSKWPPKPFKFAILSSGFLPLDPRLKQMFEAPLQTPSLHILGRGDTIVGTGEFARSWCMCETVHLTLWLDADRSLPLVDAFDDARVEWHDGGHHIPNKASWRNFFKAYLGEFAVGGQGADGAKALPSPSGAVSPPGSDRGVSPGKL
ncbi:Family of serine hydrolases 3 [Microbotryomycetes sp. JL201]|nr:Family of serine hydrolases 3 [Microbotryomycetes sp. JL201]